MNKLLYISISLLLLAGCKKDDETKPSPDSENPGSGNNGYVVPGAVGQWLHGTFAMADYWSYDGSYLGNPFSQSVAFDFKSNGTYEMYYAGEANDFGCVSDAFSYFKGYAVFTDTSFVLHPQEGRFRGYYNCSPQYNFDRSAASYELNVDTFYYTFENMNDKNWMVVRFAPTDSFPSYFQATDW